MGGKCCTTLVHGSIPVVKEASQALASDYGLQEERPTLLPKLCWCSDLNRDPGSKSFMHVDGSAPTENDPSTSKGLHRQYSTASLSSSNAPTCELKKQDSGISSRSGEHKRPSSQRSTKDSGRSSSSAGSKDYDSMSESEKHREAKGIIKDFVTEMVKGRAIVVVAPSGAFTDCLLGLSRELEILKIKPKWPKDAKSRRFQLADVDEILIGTDTGYSQMETPLDDFCVTLVLKSEDCVTFRMSDVEQRDTFAACLTMFCNDAKGKVKAQANSPRTAAVGG